MSAITQTAWLPYLRPSFASRPTLKVSAPVQKLASAETSRSAKKPRLTASHLKIDRLVSLSEDWDGHGSAKPNEYAVERARNFLEEACRDTSVTVGWQSPYI